MDVHFEIQPGAAEEWGDEWIRGVVKIYVLEERSAAAAAAAAAVAAAVFTQLQSLFGGRWLQEGSIARCGTRADAIRSKTLAGCDLSQEGSAAAASAVRLGRAVLLRASLAGAAGDSGRVVRMLHVVWAQVETDSKVRKRLILS